LPEVLVALTILAVVVTVLTRVHVGTLRAGSMAQGLDAAVTELGNVAALSRLGVDDEAIRKEAESDGWTAQVAPAGLLEGGGTWKAWSVISSNRPAPLVRVYVQGGQATDNEGKVQSEDGK
jgi:Tfp pilus assembly protein PilV